MTEFCNCGSIMINGSCTNKSCSNKLEKVTPLKKKRAASAKTTTAVKTERKVTKVPRASKCITYKLSDLQPKED